MDSICYCCNITFMQGIGCTVGVTRGGSAGFREGFFLLLSSINAWSWRKWCHFWCEWVHEGTNWPLPSFPVCPLFFLKLRWCSLFRNISLKADMPRGRAGPNNFERRAEKMQWIFRQMTICYWFLVPAAPSLGLSIFRGHGGLIFGSSANSFKKEEAPFIFGEKKGTGVAKKKGVYQEWKNNLS